MTDHPVDGDTVRLLHRRAREAIQGFSQSLPAYDSVPTRMVEADFVRGTQLNVDLFIRTIATGAPPTDAELEPVVEIAKTRYEDGVPLEEIIGNYHRVVDAIWSLLQSDEELTTRLDVNRFAIDIVHYVTQAVSRIALACNGARAQIDSPNRTEIHQVIIAALLNGHEPAPAVTLRGPALAQTYSVAVLRLDSDADATYSRAIGHRLACLDGAMVSASQSGWILLLAHTDSSVPSPESVAAELTSITRDGSDDDAPAQLIGGVARAEQRSQIPDAYRDARRICNLRAISTEPLQPVVAPVDILFDYLVASGDAGDQLLRLREIVTAEPALPDTLTAFLANESNQLAAARAMHVHRNTVSHRLARIHELTGHDPTTPIGAAIHQAAHLTEKLREVEAAD